MSIPKTVGATEVRNHFGKFLNRVYRNEEHLVVEKGGIPVAALIGMREYEEFRRWLAKRIIHEMGPQLQKAAEAQGMTEEELLARLKEDREAVHKQYYQK